MLQEEFIEEGHSGLGHTRGEKMEKMRSHGPGVCFRDWTRSTLIEDKKCLDEEYFEARLMRLRDPPWLAPGVRQ